MTLKGGTSHACAACKYQRRRCTSECPLAQYFPADQPRKFQNAHRLFGVRKITKMLEELPPPQKSVAMQSIIYQANMRDLFPVDGCSGVIRHLTYQIWQKEEELQAVQSQLEMYRQQQVFAAPSDVGNVPPQELELVMAPPTNNVVHNESNDNNNDYENALSLFGYSPDQQHYNPATSVLPLQQQQYSYPTSNNIGTGYVGYGSGFSDNQDNASSSHDHMVSNAMWVNQKHQYVTANVVTNNSSMPIHQSSYGPTPALLQPQATQQEVVHDYDEIHPFFDTIDDRQSYIDSKEAYDSSSEESLKDTTQSVEHVAENELKNAAACFSLTNVN